VAGSDVGGVGVLVISCALAVYLGANANLRECYSTTLVNKDNESKGLF